MRRGEVALLGYLKLSGFNDLSIGIGQVVNVDATRKFIQVEQELILCQGGGKDFLS